MSKRNSRVVIYSSPFCGYCSAAKRLLKSKDIDFEEINIVFDAAKREEMIALSGRRTVPQIFVDGTHVGGCDDLYELEARGGLDTLLGPPENGNENQCELTGEEQNHG